MIIPNQGPIRDYVYEIGYHLRRGVLYDPDYSRIQDREVYEKMRKDTTVSQAIDYLKLQVSGPNFEIDPVEETPQAIHAATIMDRLMRRIPDFSESLYELSEAIIRGISWQRIYGGRREIEMPGDVSARQWWCVTKLEDVD